jgi:hypothetical protein
MNVLRNDHTVYFDVDETLVLWNVPPELADKTIAIGCDHFVEHVLPHEKHILQLKQHRARGHAIIVWSQGGHEWAEAVVIALGLQDYVDAVMRKPTWYYDDLKSSSFMGEPIYYPPPTTP